MAETLFVALLKTSATVSTVIILILLLSPIINKRFAAKWKYYTWLVLAISLLIPISITLPRAPVNITIPDVQYSVPLHEEEPVMPSVAAEVTPEQVHHQTIVPPAQTATRKTITLTQMVMVLWLVGFAAFLLWHIGCYIVLKRRLLRFGNAPISQNTRSAFDSAEEKMGRCKAVRLCVCKQAAGPMILGYFRPIIVLPMDTYSPRELDFIFSHELTHLRRGDLWYKLFLLFANAVHWFNPVVYLMVKNAASDIELCCDDEVAGKLCFDERQAYGEAILSAAAAHGKLCASLTTAFKGGKNQLKRRILNLFDTGKKRGGIVLLLIVVLVIALTGTLVACSPNSSQSIVVAPVALSSNVSSESAQTVDSLEPATASALLSDYGYGITRNLEGFPCTGIRLSDDQVTVYLTSITLYEDSAMVTYLLGKDEPSEEIILPELTAISSNGTEYPLTPQSGVASYIKYSCEDVPVSDIKNLRVGDETLLISAPLYNHPNALNITDEKFDDIPQMSIQELVAYLIGRRGSGEAHKSATSELIQRFISAPLEFGSVFYDSSSVWGFDNGTKSWMLQQICGICYPNYYKANRAAFDAAVSTMSKNGFPILAQKFSRCIGLFIYRLNN